jgi:hypothetical protein
VWFSCDFNVEIMWLWCDFNVNLTMFFVTSKQHDFNVVFQVMETLKSRFEIQCIKNHVILVWFWRDIPLSKSHEFNVVLHVIKIHRNLYKLLFPLNFQKSSSCHSSSSSFIRTPFSGYYLPSPNFYRGLLMDRNIFLCQWYLGWNPRFFSSSNILLL